MTWYDNRCDGDDDDDDGQYLHVLLYNVNHAAVMDIDVRRIIVNAVLSSMASKGDTTRTACDCSRHCCIGGGTHLHPPLELDGTSQLDTRCIT